MSWPDALAWFAIGGLFGLVTLVPGWLAARRLFVRGRVTKTDVGLVYGGLVAGLLAALALVIWATATAPEPLLVGW